MITRNAGCLLHLLLLVPPMAYNVTMQRGYVRQVVRDLESFVLHLSQGSLICSAPGSACIPLTGLIDASLNVLIDIRELPLNPQYSGMYRVL